MATFALSIPGLFENIPPSGSIAYIACVNESVSDEYLRSISRPQYPYLIITSQSTGVRGPDFHTINSGYMPWTSKRSYSPSIPHAQRAISTQKRSSHSIATTRYTRYHKTHASVLRRQQTDNGAR